ncbi:hypothetical protein RNJ44_02864 [Nakaseomyces bracarensis]|uniref:chitinase n=1 Tax=Nakaseomyces bracarensis TaxID=273131 RepID=A0ABR4P0I0_9SACH
MSLVGNKRRIIVFFVVLIISVILQMCLHYRIFKPMRRPNREKTAEDKMDRSYITALYYSNWSPYEPRLHFPHDIDFEKVSHIYYAFFTVDSSTGRVKSSDTWSDFEMNLASQCREVMLSRLQGDELKKIANIKIPLGCIGELNYLRFVYHKVRNKNIHMIMSVGGWSNREEFPKIVRDNGKLEQFIESCLEVMILNGFDGIDLDWEFPADDGFEPLKYFEIVSKLKNRMLDLEEEIYGTRNQNKFQLSMATPAFNQKLSILPLRQMDNYIDIWNMMTYDYYGEWSEYTGLHSNLYTAKGNGHHIHTPKNEKEDLSGNSAIKYMLDKIKISPEKLVLGIAAYGRGFTNVNIAKHTDKLETPYGLKYNGVGGASEGEPGMWLYNQLPIKGSEEIFLPNYGSAYCFDVKSNTLVGYDNPDSVIQKAKYVIENSLGGAFWWESCGDTHSRTDRSLISNYRKVVGEIQKNSPSAFFDTEFHEYYLTKFNEAGFLFNFIENIIQDI